jgi:hypothetical protein
LLRATHWGAAADANAAIDNKREQNLIDTALDAAQMVEVTFVSTSWRTSKTRPGSAGPG